MPSIYTGCPRKGKLFIDHNTIGFCLIIKFSFGFYRKYSDLDFETQLRQIPHKLTEIHQFQQ